MDDTTNISEAERLWMNRAQDAGVISDNCVRFLEIPACDRHLAYRRLGKMKSAGKEQAQ